VSSRQLTPSGRLGAAGAYLVMFLFPALAAAQALPATPPTTPPATPPLAAQNPSPMAEESRAHERLIQKTLRGTTRTFDGPLNKPVEVFVPDRARGRDMVNVVITFHSTAWLAKQAVTSTDNRAVTAALNLGSGSGAYHRPFADPAAFDTLLAAISREVSTVSGKPTAFGKITLVGFSAGHGAIRAILLDARHFKRVDAILLLDGMHTSYVPEGVVLANGGTIDTTNLIAFRDFAHAAMRGEKDFVVTHSEIFPGTFVSTTETANWLLHAIGVVRRPVLRWGPRGMQQLSEARSGRLAVLGYAGNSAPDHIDQQHSMPELLARLLKR